MVNVGKPENVQCRKFEKLCTNNWIKLYRVFIAFTAHSSPGNYPKHEFLSRGKHNKSSTLPTNNKILKYCRPEGWLFMWVHPLLVRSSFFLWGRLPFPFGGKCRYDFFRFNTAHWCKVAPQAHIYEKGFRYICCWRVPSHQTARARTQINPCHFSHSTY